MGSLWSADNRGKVKPPRYAVVNGIRVEVLSLDEARLALGKSDAEGPVFSVSRPSMAIEDPAAVCPINLQRSAISFDRMGMDSKLGKHILRHFLSDLLPKYDPDAPTDTFTVFLAQAQSSRGVKFHGCASSPFAVTPEGVLPVTPRFFAELGIRTLYFVDTKRPPKNASQSFLASSEALVFRVASRDAGEQANLSWFRALFSGTESLRSAYSGLPLLDRFNEFGLVTAETWKLVNVRGKVAKSITGRLEVHKKPGSRALLLAKDAVPSPTALARLDTVAAEFEHDTEIGVWLLEPKQQNATPSLLVDVWLEIVGESLYRRLTGLKASTGKRTGRRGAISA
jgi:hypothetical protein